MKKVIAILLTCILIMLLLCSCSSNSNVDNDHSKTTTKIATEKTTETTMVTTEKKSVESSDEWSVLTDSFGLEHPCLNISSDEFLDRVKKYSGYLSFSYYSTASNNDATTYVYRCEYNPPYSTNYTMVYIISDYKNTIENATIQARLLTTDSYGIADADALFGFVAGICAGNYDITDIFIDATFKIIGRNYNELEALLIKLNDLSIVNNVDIILTLSCKQDDLPEKVHLGPWEQLIF